MQVITATSLVPPNTCHFPPHGNDDRLEVGWTEGRLQIMVYPNKTSASYHNRLSGSLNTHHFPRLMGGRVDLRGAAPSPRRPGCTLVKRSPPVQDKKYKYKTNTKYKTQITKYKYEDLHQPGPGSTLIKRFPPVQWRTLSAGALSTTSQQQQQPATLPCHLATPSATLPCYFNHSMCHPNMPWSSSSNCHHIMPCSSAC